MKFWGILFLAPVCFSALAWGGQEYKAHRVECKLQDIDLYQTEFQKTLTEYRIHPEFNQENIKHGEDSVVLYSDAGFKIGVRLSYLKYTPLVSMYILAGEVLVESGIQASVTHPKTGRQIVIACAPRS